MRTRISGADFAEMICCASLALTAQREPINKLNVFPVPDGDTGTNMSLTLSAAAKALEGKNGVPLGEAAGLCANALLRGARGNSGVILSLLFRGLAKSLKGREDCDAAEWAKAMREGVDAAYSAVMKPAEGTILTVSRRMAEMAVEASAACGDVEEVLQAAVECGRETLAETREMNPVLMKAGVVDAGGKGWLVIVETMLEALRGQFVRPELGEDRESADFAAIEDEEITFTYCTEFIVGRESDRDGALIRAWLETIGDSLVFVEDDEIIKVHVHTDQPGEVLTQALLYGPLQTVKIENMRNQHTTLAQGVAPAEKTEPDFAAAEKDVGFVAVCAGEGLSELFTTLGCDRVVTGGQTMNPSTDDILSAVNRTPAETVFVFPNNKNIIMAAEQCIPLTEKKVVVVPTRTVPQGISALAYRNPDLPVAEMAEEFMESAKRVHTALVTYAARDSSFDGHNIRAGEYLALMDGALLGSFTNLATLLKELNWALEELEPEFLTVYYGEDVEEGEAEKVVESLEHCFAEAEVSLVNGGQPVYYYMISAE
ncbi:MAG: DAK2 domain-containing protein [Oscillospiraceae bacterium]|nr:DAK2 domain-containing protein [Oscillospiraceae bacterium]